MKSLLDLWNYKQDDREIAAHCVPAFAIPGTLTLPLFTLFASLTYAYHYLMILIKSLSLSLSLSDDANKIKTLNIERA